MLSILYVDFTVKSSLIQVFRDTVDILAQHFHFIEVSGFMFGF